MLAEQVARHWRTGGDVLAPITVLVPDQRIAGYCKFVVADRLGICANLSFRFLDRYLGESVPPEAVPGDLRTGAGAPGPAPARPVRIADRELFTVLLARLLADEELLARPDCEPLRRYLERTEGRDARAVRRMQLGRTLAGLFSEYVLWRPDMLAQWTGATGAPAASDTERWQRHLWRALAGSGGLLEQASTHCGVRWLPLCTAVQLPLAVRGPLHAIGFSLLAPTHQRVLAALAASTALYVHALNPCMEFWEDLPRVRHVASSAGEPPALSLWGRPGRDAVRILDQLSDCDFSARFVDPGSGAPLEVSLPVAPPAPPSLLTLLQTDILLRRPPAAVTQPADDSLRVLACPSQRRELEIVASEIRALLAGDATLRASDIAVLLCDTSAGAYQALVSAVFGEAGALPHHLVDVPLATESRIVEAFELLITLPLGQFTRPEMLQVATHPAVVGRFEGIDPDDWVALSERLGIVRGADHRDHADTYIEQDLYNWQQGVRRLALGAFMAGSASGIETAVDFGGVAYVPEELTGDLRSSAAQFSLLVQSLIGDARHAAAAELPLAGWQAWFEALIAAYLQPQSEQDERNLARCRELLARLGALDLDRQRFDYRSVCELLRARLRQLRTDRGDFLAGGVTVAPLRAVAGLPFRVIFVCGLGQGAFPGRDGEHPLDLRRAAPRAGDLAPGERDRYRFLEVLLAARERLILSYVARDPVSGETLAPASVVSELGELVASYLGEAGAARLVCHHPPHAHDPTYFPALQAALPAAPPPALPAPAGELALAAAPSAAAAARRRCRVVALRRHLDHHLQERGLAPDPAALRSLVTHSPALVGLRALLGMDIPLPEAPPLTGPVSLPLRRLREFLECPLQAWARQVLGLREEEEEDLRGRRDEPLALERGHEVGFLRAVLAEHLRAPAGAEAVAALEERYLRRATHLELTGRAPTGPFARVYRQRHLALLRAWHEALCRAGGGTAPALAPVTLGRGREHGAPGSLLPPLCIDLPLGDPPRPVRIELWGTTQPLAHDALAGVGSLLPLPRPCLDKDLLRGLCDLVVLAAAGALAPDESEAWAITLLTPEGAVVHRLPPWTADQARTYLAEVLTAFLGGPHAYLLPCEAVLQWRKRRAAPLAAVIRQLRGRQQGLSSLHGPVRDIAALEPPPHCEAVAERRFEPLLGRLEAEQRATGCPPDSTPPRDSQPPAGRARTGRRTAPPPREHP